MKKLAVAIVQYEKPLESVRRVVALSNGLDQLKPHSKVFIKPNIVFWARTAVFPKWGVITTSRVVEDMVVLLKERGIDDITISDGMVVEPNDTETPAHAFESLGYAKLKKRYGVRFFPMMAHPFEKVDLGDGVVLNFNEDILHSDFIVNLPVLKTHSQTVVSLGIKNLKGTIDIASRKKCHNADPGKDLHYMVARLADKMPSMLTLIDGIYSNERGPGFDGHIHRTNLLVASSDVLAADMVGAQLLGQDPMDVPHLVYAAKNRKRPLDMSDIEVKGETIEDLAKHRETTFEFSQADDGSWLPAPLVKKGMKGISYRRFDLSLCTYCVEAYSRILAAVIDAWRKGQRWDKVEILSGKSMKPTPGMKKTILLGKCIYQANKDNPAIEEMIAVKGCPPKAENIVKALEQAGIKINPVLIQDPAFLPELLMKQYQDRPDFDEQFYMVGE
ncbi:MAG: DUF362 domain-containing protein [Deltaproteobacteria bacterium]|nr:DUF362 domain-containing protein [Deltaproteobacteria bacterium]